MKREYLFLALVIIFFLITRLYKIDSNPSSLYWDEVSIAYNAYSVLKTGRDEWGQFLPIHFRAFGEFKLPVYIYTTSLSETIFGLNEIAVRIPAVVFSLLSIFFLFLFVKKITKNITISILSSFILAVTPWFFIFSRTGYEATAGLMFFVLALYLLIICKNNIYFILPSFLSLILCIYSYNSFRVIAPLVLLFFLFFLKREINWHLKKNLLVILFSLTIVLVSFIPIMRVYTQDFGFSRFQAVNVFRQDTLPVSIYHFIENYISHFNPIFLFVNGDQNIRSQQKGWGELYLIQLPFLISGLIYILKNMNRYNSMILFMLLISPIPAAITFESPHALRSITAIPFISAITAIGIFQLINKLKFKKILYFSTIIIFMIFFGKFYDDFQKNYRSYSSIHWQYPYKILFMDYKNEFSQFDHIIISDYLAQPYIFLLYYLQYPPEKIKDNIAYNSYDKWGFSTVNKIDKYSFGSIDIKDIIKGRYLIFASPQKRLEGVQEKKTVVDLEGNVTFYVYEINK